MKLILNQGCFIQINLKIAKASQDVFFQKKAHPEQLEGHSDDDGCAGKILDK